MQIAKGLKSRGEILEQTRVILNDEGTGITLAELAQKLNSTLGKITYHFPTKDHLYIALGEQYQHEFRLLTKPSVSEEFTFQYFHHQASKIMDLQYKYRNVIRYMTTSVKAQGALNKHLSDSFRSDRNLISVLFRQLIEAGSMQEKILHPDSFEVVLFQFTTLFTSWIISLEIYDRNQSYEAMKPIYLKGILACFEPYCTPKGRDELARAGMPGSTL